MTRGSCLAYCLPMQWSDEALILSVRPHGETAAVVELLTARNGRHVGLVHGGRSRRLRPQRVNGVDLGFGRTRAK